MMPGALGMVLLFGILGLAWWGWRHRPGCQPATRLRRVRAAAMIAGLVIVAVGSVGRLTTVYRATPACTPPGGQQAAARSSRFDVPLIAQEAATWPETGIGLLYSQARNARVCLSRSADYYVAVHADNIAGTNALTLGDIVLTPGFDVSKEQLRTLIGHEARHRAQWSVATAVAGPFAFPVAYGIVGFFFPGPRNFFERAAGLTSGGYRHSGTGPVLGPAQLCTLGVLAVIIVLALLRLWHRHALSRSRGRADAPGACTDRRMTDGLTRDE